MDLLGFDLNLLVTLEALLETRSVTATARRLGRSQPAVSSALARLRDALGDPLLVRSGRQMLATPHAESLRAPLRRALAAVGDVVSPPGGFDPETSSCTFRIVSTDYGQLTVLPRLVARVAATAPGVDIYVSALGPRSVADLLAEPEIDLAIWVGRESALPQHLYRQPLCADPFVCVVRADHPSIGDALTLDAYLSHPHVLVSPRGDARGVVDEALEPRGLRRRVALVLPHFLTAPWSLLTTDYVWTAPLSVARPFTERFPLRLLEPPIELPCGVLTSVWHERTNASAAHRWLRAAALRVDPPD